jgi:hypothetical protein
VRLICVLFWHSFIRSTSGMSCPSRGCSLTTQRVLQGQRMGVTGALTQLLQCLGRGRPFVRTKLPMNACLFSLSLDVPAFPAHHSRNFGYSQSLPEDHLDQGTQKQECRLYLRLVYQYPKAVFSVVLAYTAYTDIISHGIKFSTTYTI